MDLMGIARNTIRKWSSVTVTVGRGEDAQCKWERKLVREEKSKPFWRELMDGFVDDGEGGETHDGERISRLWCQCQWGRNLNRYGGELMEGFIGDSEGEGEGGERISRLRCQCWWGRNPNHSNGC
jgi:hypothetical protein